MYVIVKKQRWYHRLWHHILTVLGKECYTLEVSEDSDYQLILDKMFLCPSCWKYKCWEFGCSDEHPDICDDCWCERREKNESRGSVSQEGSD